MAFDRETMKGVVRHYAAQRLQDIDCPHCEFQPYEDPEQTIPEGWEEMRAYPWLVKQCHMHDAPLHPWLRDASLDKAVDWLVLQSKKGPFQVNFEEWRRAVEGKI